MNGRTKLWRTGSALLAFERGSLARFLDESDFDDLDRDDLDRDDLDRDDLDRGGSDFAVDDLDADDDAHDADVADVADVADDAAVADDVDAEPAAWRATHVERFTPCEDIAQLAVALWRDDWDTMLTGDRVLASTWDRYPEEPAVHLEAPLLERSGEDPKPLVVEALRDFRDIDWVVSVDLIGRIFVWERSDDPADGDTGVRRTFGFMPVPSETERIEVWLQIMRPTERVVAQMVLAMMRFERWSTTTRPARVPTLEDTAYRLWEAAAGAESTLRPDEG